MKRTVNTIFHGIGAGIFLYGTLLAVKAAGMADLGGDFGEIMRIVLCGICALGVGAFVGCWKV